jgi:hypothetical protein
VGSAPLGPHVRPYRTMRAAVLAARTSLRQLDQNHHAAHNRNVASGAGASHVQSFTAHHVDAGGEHVTFRASTGPRRAGDGVVGRRSSPVSASRIRDVSRPSVSTPV